MRADTGTNNYKEQKNHPHEQENKHRVPPFSSFSITSSVLQSQRLQAGLLAVLVVPAVLRRFSPEAYPKEWEGDIA